MQNTGNAYLVVNVAGALLALALPGCGQSGPASGSLTGKVTYKGTPVGGAVVTLYSKDKGVFSDTTRADGTYTISGLVPMGDADVAIVTPSGGGVLDPAKMAAERAGDPRAEKMAAKMKEGMKYLPKTGTAAPSAKVPGKYADPAKSGLKVTYNGGKQEKDFNLTD